MAKLNRRSFLARVTGSVALAGAAKALLAASAYAIARAHTDRDAHDPVNRGVHHSDAMSDNDGPPMQDSGQQQLARGKPIADADGSDPVAPGRGYQNCNDQDSGDRADLRGFGRACTPRRSDAPTTMTDTDRGPKEDRAGYGRAEPTP